MRAFLFNGKAGDENCGFSFPMRGETGTRGKREMKVGEEDMGITITMACACNLFVNT